MIILVSGAQTWGELTQVDHIKQGASMTLLICHATDSQLKESDVFVVFDEL
jgi:hypothetical protein